MERRVYALCFNGTNSSQPDGRAPQENSQEGNLCGAGGGGIVAGGKVRA